ncbi:MAG: hypothetical protein PHE88_02805 [Elusimicrobia bacterium]|nr:hypothetical protein [Elusimicrobiota bacterium]
MTKEELLPYIFDSNIFKSWHWFYWHFLHTLKGEPQPFADSFIEACLACEKIIPDFAIGMVNNIASISGKVKDTQHYEQLIQRLAELHIIKQILTFDWPNKPKFKCEPTTKFSKKNPELTIDLDGKIVGVEVKAPSLLQHYENLCGNSTQILSRSLPLNVTEALDKKIILPRDNPVKDFLISANEKFQPFKNEYPEFIGILVIVWGAAIQEPISALLAPGSGLITENSFAKDERGKILQFPSIDSVIVVSHLHQIIKATKDEPFMDSCHHVFDYGSKDKLPFKIFMPLSPNIPKIFLKCMQVQLQNPEMGSEYIPSDLILWLDPSKGKT